MALWSDNKKCLWIDRSGLQYRRSMRCAVPSDAAASIISRFFVSRGAMPDAASTGQAMTFTRGREWVSRLSWLVPLSETWPRQTITVSIRQDGQDDDTSGLEVSYDVRMLFTFVFAPNALEKEARELQSLLQTTIPLNGDSIGSAPG